MRTTVLAVVLASQCWIVASAAAQQTKQADAFRHYAHDMALSTLRNAHQRPENRRFVDEVLTGCIFQVPAEALVGSKRDEWMEPAKREVAAEIQKVTEQALAERAEEEQAGSRYFHCLERAAQVLAFSSDESADIVAQASLSACPTARADLFPGPSTTRRRMERTPMLVTENVFIQRVLLCVVAARAQHRIAPTPTSEPKLHKTPI